MTAVWRDIRYAARGMRRFPGFTALCVLSLGLAIGAATAVFSLTDALLLRQLAVPQPGRLVTLEQVFPDGSRQYNFAVPDMERFEQVGAFSGISATTWADAYNVRADGSAEADERLARVSVVTGSFFPTLGVRAAAGRLFDTRDESSGRAVVVISDAYWMRRFGRAPNVVGRTLTFNRVTYEIIGVTPAAFSGDWVGWPTDFWVPVSMGPAVFGEPAIGAPRGMRRQYKLIARLAPGVGVPAAQQAAAVVYGAMQREPVAGSGVSRDARLDVVSAATGYSRQRDTFGRPLAALMMAVGVVVLVACANVANLLLARTSSRTREIAVRGAIGAGRGRIFAQLMTEGALLAAGAGAVGLVVATWATDLLASIARSGPVGSVTFGASLVDVDVHIDARQLAFTATLCALTAVLSSLIPAFRASSMPAGTLATRGPRSDASPATRFLRRALVVAQVALSLALLVGTVLFVRTLVNLKQQELGFDRQHLLLAWTLPVSTGRDAAALPALWDAVIARIGSTPGVVSASASAEGLLGGAPAGGPLARPLGATPDQALRVDATMTIAPKFFATVGQRLLRGREFTPADDGAATPVAIVNESAARGWFGAEEAVGRSLVLGTGSGSRVTIVGVVADSTHNLPRARAARLLYYPARQNVRRLRSMCVVVRTAGDPAAVSTGVRQALRATDAALPVMAIDTVDEQLDALLFQDRLVADLAIAFGTLAAVLAGSGLCGVLLYSVTSRTSEIGVRVALGATRAAVARMVVRDTLVLVLPGIAIGIPLALAAARLVAHRLFGVGAADLLSLALATATIVAVSLAAALVPAARASSVDPLVALRCD